MDQGKGQRAFQQCSLSGQGWPREDCWRAVQDGQAHLSVHRCGEVQGQRVSYDLFSSIARRLVKDLVATGQLKHLEAHSRQVLAVSTAPPKKADEATAKGTDAKDVKKGVKKGGKPTADKEK